MTITLFKSLTVVAFLCFGSAYAGEPIRIDATTNASAQASWHKMYAQADPSTKHKLISALVELNLAGVNSAYEVVKNPDLQTLSAARIKDKIAGLTADQIVELANKTSTVKIQQHGQ